MNQDEQEIMETETAFAKLALQKGVKEAFLAYAAEDAVLMRGSQLIKGKTEIAAYFDQQTYRRVQLVWAPDFIKVAKAGDLAYTYGRFTFEAINNEGNEIKSEGYFHTVWQRQPNGEWRFVWD